MAHNLKDERIPKGKLIAIGGNEDKGTDEDNHQSPYSSLNFFELGILKRIVEETGKGLDAKIAVITSASSIPKELGNNYVKAFDKLNCKNVDVLHIKSQSDANSTDFVERVRRADAVMFTGGDQQRLTNIIGDTRVHKLLLERYMEEEIVIAGTSAGAMAMSDIMIFGGSSVQALQKGHVKMMKGLGFIKEAIIDSHFIIRGRFGRLIHAVAENNEHIGVGLAENTGVLITKGCEFETIGTALVIIFDGSEMKHINFDNIPETAPISIEHMIVHVLAFGYRYDLHKRKFIPSDIVLQ